MSTLAATNLKHASSASNNIVLDTSGNVGIGASSPATKLDVSGTSRYTFNVANAYTLQTSINAAGSAFADGYQNALSHIWQTSGTERMRIDSSGNVGIGTSSPGKKLDLYSAGTATTDFIIRNDTVSYLSFVDSGAAYTGTSTNHPLLFNTNNSERMRINTSGNLLVGTTSTLSGVSAQTYIQVNGYVGAAGYASHAGTAGVYGGNNFNLYWNGSAVRLWVDTTDLGGITVSSDYRVKKDIKTQAATALDRVLQIRPVTYTYADYAPFNWKADGVSREGFIAHELAAIIPSAVEGEKDEPNKVQSLKLDALCSVLVKAIQELKADFDAYKAAHP